MRLIEAADRGSTAPELKELVTEATRALARLDIARLEELALSCQALTRMPAARTEEERAERARQARAIRGDMEVFARVLEASRANLKVMRRLREIRLGKAGYAERLSGPGGWSRKNREAGDGND